MWTDKQAENSTFPFPHPSDVAGNNTNTRCTFQLILTNGDEIISLYPSFHSNSTSGIQTRDEFCVIKSAEIEIEITDRDSGTVLVSRQTNKNFPQTKKNFQTN